MPKGKEVRCFVNRKLMQEVVDELSIAEKQIIANKEDALTLTRIESDKNVSMLTVKVDNGQYCLFIGRFWIDYLKETPYIKIEQ